MRQIDGTLGDHLGLQDKGDKAYGSHWLAPVIHSRQNLFRPSNIVKSSCRFHGVYMVGKETELRCECYVILALSFSVAVTDKSDAGMNELSLSSLFIHISSY